MDVVGDVNGEAEVKEVNATLDNRTPFVLEVTSNCAELEGVVVPIPTCAFTVQNGVVIKTNKEKNLSGDIVFYSTNLQTKWFTQNQLITSIFFLYLHYSGNYGKSVIQSCVFAFILFVQ
jgi:hypothetical protein